jgi:hypothetical protein
MNIVNIKGPDMGGVSTVSGVVVEGVHCNISGKYIIRKHI